MIAPEGAQARIMGEGRNIYRMSFFSTIITVIIMSIVFVLPSYSYHY